jgi:hypothetical protein
MLVSIDQKLSATKHELRNLPPAEACQVLASGLTRILMLMQLEPPNHIPTKTCNVLGAMFWSCAPIFHVPPCNPHCYPMTNP